MIRFLDGGIMGARNRFTTVGWHEGRVRLIDQRQLPGQVVYLDCADHHEVAEAIRNLSVRGAPAIGIAAAMGLALGARSIQTRDPDHFLRELSRIADELAATRPTAVNLFWALDRMKRVAASCRNLGAALVTRLIDESQAILDEDIAMNRAMGKIGAALIEGGDTILTHCNAGALATGGYGTALGVIRAAWEDGKKIRVIVDETRPVLQGARLPAWELMQDDIPVTLITDNMAGALMREGGSALHRGRRPHPMATWPTRSGRGVAVLARHHGIPSTSPPHLHAGPVDPLGRPHSHRSARPARGDPCPRPRPHRARRRRRGQPCVRRNPRRLDHRDHHLKWGVSPQGHPPSGRRSRGDRGVSTGLTRERQPERSSPTRITPHTTPAARTAVITAAAPGPGPLGKRVALGPDPVHHGLNPRVQQLDHQHAQPASDSSALHARPPQPRSERGEDGEQRQLQAKRRLAAKGAQNPPTRGPPRRADGRR
jgi:methylthioribose-1-phosphate isomerase